MSPRRSLYAAALCMMVSCVTCLGQNPATFTTVTSNSGATPATIYTADVNNDGLSDIIQTTLSAPIEFTVSLAKGNGAFGPPQAYPFPSGLAASPSIAFADFNGDGKVDIVAPIVAKNEIALYLGNGNGTFQAAKLITGVLPSGYTFQNTVPVPADYNHDGKIDLVAIAVQSSGVYSAVVLEGNGAGSFTYKGDIYNAASSFMISTPVTGDFDADNNADVAFVTSEYCDNGAAICDGAVRVLYGNGNFGFTDTTPYTSTDGLSLASGDLNGDGRTDLFAENGTTAQLVLLYGQTNRTFSTYYYNDVPSGGVTNLAMADFNGDGHMDLVGFDYSYSTTTGSAFQLAFFLSAGTPGAFRTQIYALPYDQTDTNVVVGNFTGVPRPDVAIVQNPAPSGTGSSTIDAIINKTSDGNFGGCTYPMAGEGISVCSPMGGSASNPVSFKASATSFGDIRKFELWVDGKKVDEEHNSWGNFAYFDLKTNLSTGSHNVTLDFTTVDNDVLNDNFTLNVQ